MSAAGVASAPAMASMNADRPEGPSRSSAVRREKFVPHKQPVVHDEIAGNHDADSGSVAAPPVNDDCANAITVGDGLHSFTTAEATTDGPEEPVACNFFAYQDVFADVWFRYNASCTGELRASLCGSNYDSKLAVYDGCGCPPRSPALGCNDDFCGVDAVVDVPVTEDQCYTLRVGGYLERSGSGTLSVVCTPDTAPTGACCSASAVCVGTLTEQSCTAQLGTWYEGQACPAFACPPANDDCPDAIPVQTNVPYNGTTGGATGTANSGCSVGDAKDVWHRWTADCTGQAAFSLCLSGFDTTVAVYDACDGAELACSDDECGSQLSRSLALAFVEQGTTYYIRVAGFNGASGNYTLIVEPCAVACCSTTGICAMRTPTMCTAVTGISRGPGSFCQGDTNGNLRDDVCDTDPWVFKDYNGSASDGFLPDFDQVQDFDNLDSDDNPATGVEPYFSGPTAVANSLWWFHRKYPTLDVVPPGYTPVDLIRDLSERMNTNDPPAGVGTDPRDLGSGIDAYLGDNGLNHLFVHHNEASPTFDFVVEEITRSQDVTLLLGFYAVQSVDPIPNTGFVVHWRRFGGHYVTVAGVDPLNRRVAVSDPEGDFKEEGFFGFLRRPDHNHDGDGDPGTNTFFRHKEYNHTRHNDERRASHDFINAVSAFTPVGDWHLELNNNPTLYADIQSFFHVNDAGGSFDAGESFVTPAFLSANGLPTPAIGQVYTAVEAGVVVSPADPQACCFTGFSCSSLSPPDCVVQGGEPQGGGVACMGNNNPTPGDDLCEPCPAATIAQANPLNGTVDSRQPNILLDELLRQGIGAPGEPGSAREPIVLTLNPPLAGVNRCFRLCETRSDPQLGPNAIGAVTALGAGRYEIVLDHPITAGGVTTIRYRGDGFVAYTAHPANVNAAGPVESLDMTVLINCCLLQQCSAPWGDYSCDVDHSGLVAPLDALRAADLMNGAHTFSTWSGTPLPVNSSCP